MFESAKHATQWFGFYNLQVQEQGPDKLIWSKSHSLLITNSGTFASNLLCKIISCGSIHTALKIFLMWKHIYFVL